MLRAVTVTDFFAPWSFPILLGSTAGRALTVTSLVTLWAQCPSGMDVQFYYSADGGARWTLIDPVSQISGTGGAYFDPVSNNLGYLGVGLLHDDLYRITNDAHSWVP